MDTDTIVAPASAPVSQAVGIVRLSGSLSFEIAEKIIQPTKLPFAGSFSFRQIINPTNKEMIDSGLVLVFKSPHSFTGEDSVEFQVHGSPAVLDKITNIAVTLGARKADAGEFSFRAFLNGKSTMAKLELGNAITHLSSTSNISGIDKQIKIIRAKLQNISTSIEAGISFSNDSQISSSEIIEDILNLSTQIIEIISMCAKPGAYQVVIAGPPNAGKSTLFNHLVGFERTVISPAAGTTRDYIKAEISLSDNRIELIDGPGLDIDNPDSGQDLVRKIIDTSDVILWLDPFAKLVSTKINMVKVQSKTDSNQNITDDWLPLSVKNKTGIKQLTSRIISLLPTPEYAVTNRQLVVLQKLSEKMLSAVSVPDLDMKAFEINDALKMVSELDGVNCSTETVKQIFGSFCIGK